MRAKRLIELTTDEVMVIHGALVSNPFYSEGDNPNMDSVLSKMERAGTEMIYEEYEAANQLSILETETPEIVTIYVLANQWLFHVRERIRNNGI